MDGNLTKALLVLMGLALGAPFCGAASVNNEWLSTTRNLSMGNVGVASSEDPSSAMFYNPAALARAKRASVEILNPQVEMGTGVFGFGSVQKLGDHLSLEKIQPSLATNKDRASSLGFSLYPNLYLQSFNFGVLMSARGSSYYDGTNTVYKSQYLVMPTMAFSFAIFGNALRFGMAVRGISLTDNDQSVIPATGIGYRTDAAEGMGLAADAGLLWTSRSAGLPTLGIVARNIGDTNLGRKAYFGFGTGNVRSHESIKGTYDAGVSIFPKMGGHSVLTLAADYRDILNVSGQKTLSHLNFGGELAVNKAFYVRAGYGRGYFTGGFGLASKLGSLDIGTYSEELSNSYRGVEDRRISVRFGRRF
jgi:hypothetical protein